MAVIEREFHAPVAYRTGLDEYLRVLVHGQFGVEGLVLCIGAIVSGVEGDVVEYAEVHTYFERVCTFGLKVVHGVLGEHAPRLGVLVPLVARVGDIAVESRTYRCVAGAQFPQVEDVRSLGQVVVEQYRQTYRRIEEAAVMAVGACQLRRPVVTAGESEVVGVLETDVGRCVQRLGLLAPSGLHYSQVRSRQVLHGKEVGQTCGHTCEFVGAVGDGASCGVGVIAHVRNRAAEVGLYAPVVAERLVEAQQEVGENLLFVALGYAVAASVGAVGELGVGSGIVFLGVGVVRVVDAHTAGKGQAVEQLVAQVGTHHIAVLAVLVEVAVVYPVRVLHGHAVVAGAPVLNVDFTVRVVALVGTDVVPRIAARIKQRAYQRVAVGTLIDHVAVGLVDIAGIEVQGHTVVQKRSGVADIEVITVITVVGGNAQRVYRSSRSVCLVLVVAGREGYRLGRHEAGLEVVVRGLIVIIVERRQRSAPRHIAGGHVNAVAACAVAALQTVVDQCAVPLQA